MIWTSNTARRAGVLLVLVAAPLAAPAPAGANTYTVVIDSTASWSQARSAAILAGGYLATITSAAEQAAVVAALTAAAPPRPGAFWINLRETSECCYVWDDGETTCYANFYTAEPNNGAGQTPESRGHILWTTDAARKGFWNDAPEAGFALSPTLVDISRLGYVIEFGSPDPAGPCGTCLTVSPASFCNEPPSGAAQVRTRFSGVSAGPGVISRTITDITQPPPRPPRRWLARAQASYLVTLPIAGAGVSASAAAAAFIDSINRQVGATGFVANYENDTDDTFVQMYRVSGNFTSNDNSTVPGIVLDPILAPMTTGWAGAMLVLLLVCLASRAMRARRVSTS